MPLKRGACFAQNIRLAFQILELIASEQSLHLIYLLLKSSVPLLEFVLLRFFLLQLLVKPLVISLSLVYLLLKLCKLLLNVALIILSCLIFLLCGSHLPDKPVYLRISLLLHALLLGKPAFELRDLALKLIIVLFELALRTFVFKLLKLRFLLCSKHIRIFQRLTKLLAAFALRLLLLLRSIYTLFKLICLIVRRCALIHKIPERILHFCLPLLKLSQLRTCLSIFVFKRVNFALVKRNGIVYPLKLTLLFYDTPFMLAVL